MNRLHRKIKRNKARVVKSEFVKNQDGTPALILQRKSTRGRWINVNF